jgi:hypothetical protein
MIREGLLAKYIHIAAVVACYWYVYRLYYKCFSSHCTQYIGTRLPSDALCWNLVF